MNICGFIVNRNRIKVKSIFIYILLVALLISVIDNKRNMHIDEVLTYGLANDAKGWMMPVNGQIYSPAADAWMEYVTVEDNRFDYHMVWNNQAGDVHPPLYYALVHTICSLFAEKFSIWYAGVVNIAFAVLTLWAVRRMLNELTPSPVAVTFGSFAFILSAGILSAASFLRMYIMAMFMVTFITWLFLEAVKKGCDRKFYVAVIGTSITGALTHYYFIVYLFFLCIAFGIYLLLCKRYRDVIVFILSMAGSGSIAVMIFPNMIKHMFLKDGYRGQQSVNNLRNTDFSEYLMRVKIFYAFINEQLFGGMLTYIIITVLLFLVCRMICGKIIFIEKMADRKVLWYMMLFPSVCYFLIVTKMAVMMESRYILPIYTVVLLAIYSFLYAGMQRILDEKKQTIVLCICVSVITVNTWKTCTWEYLYLDSVTFLEKTGKYQNENVIYVYDTGWKLTWSFFEARNYKSAVFYEIDEIAELESIPYQNDESLLVNITTDSGDVNAENVLNTILQKCPLLDGYEVIGSYGYTTTYHLTGNVM